MKYRLIIPPAVECTIAGLAPDTKQLIRHALEMILHDPYAGKPLRDELKGLRSFRANRYRIIYRIRHEKIEIQVIDMALRSVIYERMLSMMQVRAGSPPEERGS